MEILSDWNRPVASIYQYKTYTDELYLDVWLFTNSRLCQFIEIVHKIINWYMKNVKYLFVSVI